MSFAAPLFLIAAIAAVIPVVLHLINRQRAKELPFSTLRFLRLSAQKTRRKKRIHDIILLILRAAVLLLIAVALAKPAIRNLSVLWGGSHSAVVIILDNSASMGTVDGAKTRLETATVAASKIIDELKDGDEAGLFLTGGPAYPELDKLYHSPEQIRQVLSLTRVSYQRADLANLLRQARALLAGSTSTTKQIYVITDLQKVSWENMKSMDKDSALSKNDESEKTPVILIDCNHTPKPNVAVQGLELEAEAPVPGLPVKASVELLNTSSISQQRIVELFVDGNKVSSSPELDLPPESRVKHDFIFTFKSGGLHIGEVRLVGDDGSKYDDRRFFAKEVGQTVPVAIVRSANNEIAYLDDAFYLENALTAGKSNGWAIRTTMLLADDLLKEPLANFKIIYCVNLPALSETAAQRLRDYVAEGGNVVWIAGDKIDAEAYNRMNELVGNQLLSLPLQGIRTAKEEKDRDSWHIAFLDKDYPPLSRLTDPASLYESVLVYNHIGMAALPGSGVRILAKLDDGEPLLAMRNTGAGNILMLGAALHTNWTNLPLRPVFLPLILRLTFDLSGIEQSQHTALAGAPLILKYEKAQQPLGVEVRTPAGETMRLMTKPMKDTKGQVFEYDDTYEIGVYSLRLLDSSRDMPIAYSVNLDPDELEPLKIESEELKTLFGKTPLIFVDNPENLSDTFNWLREGSSLWTFFLSAVLIGLIFETFVSNWLSKAIKD